MVGMNRNQTAETLFGDSLLMAAPPMNVPNPRCFLSGIDASNRHIQVPFNEDMLGRHIMLLGGIGTGKTNAFSQIIRQLRDTLRPDEVMTPKGTSTRSSTGPETSSSATIPPPPAPTGRTTGTSSTRFTAGST